MRAMFETSCVDAQGEPEDTDYLPLGAGIPEHLPFWPARRGNQRETKSAAEPMLRRKFRLRRIRELFEFEDHLVHREGIAFRRVDLPHRRLLFGAEDVFHLHRLDGG